jgi:hypothetical protein
MTSLPPASVKVWCPPCDIYPCITTPNDVNVMVARAQWLKAGYEHARKITCMNIVASEADVISEAVSFFRQRGLCWKYGCPHLPIRAPNLHLTFDNESICVPISYHKNVTDVKRIRKSMSYAVKTQLVIVNS